MRTVNLGELEAQLSGLVQYVQTGEEIVIRDRDTPVARILPFHGELGWDETELVASGQMKMPEREMNWDHFFSSEAGDVARELAVQAVVESRGDR